MKQPLFSFLFYFLMASTSFAAVSPLEDSRCVSASLQKVHDSITDYNNYTEIEGAKLSKKILIFNYPLLTMTKSQASYIKKLPNETDAIILVELQPTKLDNSRFYPQFILRCQSLWTSESEFSHACLLNKKARHYALKDFHSSLKVTKNSNICPQDRPTLLQYKLVLESDPVAVAEIREQVLGLPKFSNELAEAARQEFLSILETLYNEEEFYNTYYQNFYNGWVKSLQESKL